MSVAACAVTASRCCYIKLGVGGAWEEECLRDGTLRFGYNEAPHDLCLQGDWPGVLSAMKAARSSSGVATRDVNQIRAFYEADAQTVFITFANGLLHWTRPAGPVELLEDRSHRRSTVDGWHNTSILGTRLSADRLSGKLLKVQMFRGTICDVQAADYLLRKINDLLSPEVTVAEEAESALINALVGLMRLLTWQDFELLVDLVFSSSGWRRVSAVGGVQKTVDFELVLPVTADRAFVQIKSHATPSDLADYMVRRAQAGTYDRMFFVWHTGELSEHDLPSGVTLLGPQKLARMVLDAGLSSWLRDKVS